MSKILYFLRYLIFLPVIGSTVLAIATATVGIGRIYTGIICRFSEYDFSAKTVKAISLTTIEIVDLFLVVTVSYVVSVGLYKLFINRDFQLPGLIKIGSLNDLELKIVGVIVAALAVAFLGEAASGDSPSNLFYDGSAIALVIAALALFIKFSQSSDKQT